MRLPGPARAPQVPPCQPYRRLQRCGVMTARKSPQRVVAGAESRASAICAKRLWNAADKAPLHAKGEKAVGANRGADHGVAMCFSA